MKNHDFEAIDKMLDELKELKDGWLDGYGTAPPPEGLDWFKSWFRQEARDFWTVPEISPLGDERIFVFWCKGDCDQIHLKVDLKTHTGEFLVCTYYKEGKHISEFTFNMDDEAECHRFNMELLEFLTELPY